MSSLKTPNRELQSLCLTLLHCIRCLFYLPHPTIQMFGFLPTSELLNIRLYDSFFYETIAKCPQVYGISITCLPLLSRSSRSSSLFFILYVLMGVYFVTNLILAVVYDSFKCEVHIYWILYISLLHTTEIPSKNCKLACLLNCSWLNKWLRRTEWGQEY